MDHFVLHSEFAPTGDQPQAIEQLVKGFKEGNQWSFVDISRYADKSCLSNSRKSAPKLWQSH